MSEVTRQPGWRLGQPARRRPADGRPPRRARPRWRRSGTAAVATTSASTAGVQARTTAGAGSQSAASGRRATTVTWLAEAEQGVDHRPGGAAGTEDDGDRGPSQPGRRQRRREADPVGVVADHRRRAGGRGGHELQAVDRADTRRRRGPGWCRPPSPPACAARSRWRRGSRRRPARPRSPAARRAGRRGARITASTPVARNAASWMAGLARVADGPAEHRRVPGHGASAT
jgi:hypothetical protein